MTVDWVKLTDWQLRMEMPPEAPYIGLHHFPAHHMRIVGAVTVKQCLFLLCNR